MLGPGAEERSLFFNMVETPFCTRTHTSPVCFNHSTIHTVCGKVTSRRPLAALYDALVTPSDARTGRHKRQEEAEDAMIQLRVQRGQIYGASDPKLIAFKRSSSYTDPLSPAFPLLGAAVNRTAASRVPPDP